MKTEKIKEVIDGIFSGMENKKAKKFQAILESTEWDPSEIKGPDELDIYLIQPFEDFVEQVIRGAISDNKDVVFILMNKDLVDRSFQNIIRRTEGSACCADKSGTITNRLVHHFMSGEEIKFNYQGEYTFHLPKRLFRTHDEIIAFYEAIKSAHYGNYIPIIKQCADIAKIISAQDSECAAGRHVTNQHDGKDYCEICGEWI